MKKKNSGNPIITGIFTAEPSAHVWDDGRIYIYASHDMDPPRGCDMMDHYHVYSSSDMANWLDEGEILCAADTKWGRPEGGFMWAPDCAYRNGKYYFYYPHPSETRWNDTWKIAVAVSDKPNKDFTDLGPIEGLGGFALIDPCVFIDFDGKAYMYYGGAARCLGCEMNDDMISIKNEPVEMEGLEDFHEATWVFRRGDIYYLTYSDNLPGKNRLRYATSSSPLGPWTYRGIYLEPTDCDTSHGSVVEFKGQWYQFYHNCNISRQGNLRSVCADKLFFDENGLIKMIEQTKHGIDAVPGGKELTFPTDEFAFTAELAENEEYTLEKTSDRDTRVQITVFTDAEELSKVRLFINGEDKSLLNLYGGEGTVTFGFVKGANKLTLAAHKKSVKLTGVKLEYLD